MRLNSFQRLRSVRHGSARLAAVAFFAAQFIAGAPSYGQLGVTEPGIEPTVIPSAPRNRDSASSTVDQTIHGATGYAPPASFDVSRAGALGVDLSRTENQLAVTNVYPGGAAERAGLRSGDRITSVDGRAVHSRAELLDRLQAIGRQHASTTTNTATNTPTIISVVRNGQTLQFQANLAGAAQRTTTTAPHGTFMADVSQSVRADVEGLAADLRTAIDNTQGNVRETLISVKDRVTDISGDLVDRARETAQQARDRVDTVRAELSDIRNELTPLIDGATGIEKQQILAVRNRVDALHANLQSAADSVRARLAGVEERARSAVGNLQERVAGVQERAQEVVGTVETRLGRIANAAAAQAEAVGVEVQKRTQADLERLNADTAATRNHSLGNVREQGGALGVTVRQGSTVLTITSVAAGSAAAEAGLRAGDQILSINRRRIISHAQLIHELKAAAEGDGHALLLIRRDGRTEEVQTNLGHAAPAR
ncbi:MAG: PDZ domain-containing protein [Planctomycetia bacterium]|nr:PDZ domain-containing protein [Planctomycetia bacterium]